MKKVLTYEVLAANDYVAASYSADLNAMIYIVDPKDGTDEVVVIVGSWRARVPREELIELLEAESV